MKNWMLVLSLFCYNFAVASELHVYDDGDKTLLFHASFHGDISTMLRSIGVHYEPDCQRDIEQIKEENGFLSFDVIEMSPDHPQKDELRQKFLKEHTHNEPEMRLFVEGSGLFFIHVEAQVYSVLCEKGDLISIPENYPHWFDMGKEPLFTAIRFFTREDGWVAHFTNDPIAERFVETDCK